MVAVSYGGTKIASSTDGNTWTARTPNAMYSANGVAYGNGLWVAVGGNSGNATIKNVSTSTNGITWSGQTYSGINNIQKVAYGKNSSGNGVWIMCGQTTIATSPNGTSWTACPSTGGITDVRNVAFGKDGAGADLWIAVGYNSQKSIVRSTDGGNTWAACATNGGIKHTAISVAYGKDGAGAGLWVAVGYGGSASVVGRRSIAYSSDGDTWTSCTDAQAGGFTGQVSDVAYGKDNLGAGLWVIAASAEISGYSIGTSPDGINWTKRLVNATIGDAGTTVEYGQDALGNWLWVAGNYLNTIATSTNGTAWTSVTSNGGLAQGIRDIAFKN